MRKGKPFVQRVTDAAAYRPVVRIIKIGATQRLQFLCCSPKAWGFLTHWTKVRRTQPCMAHRKVCQHCKDMCPRRPRGYLLAADQRGVVLGFVDLTPEAFAAAVQLEKTFGTLRGKVLIVEREKQLAKAPLLLQPSAAEWDAGGNLPADQDPLPSLLRIWGMDNVD